MDRARRQLANVRGRSTTLYIDLERSNKRKRSEICTEDEEMENRHEEPDGAPPELEAIDYWDVSEDGLTWTRLHRTFRRELPVPS